MDVEHGSLSLLTFWMESKRCQTDACADTLIKLRFHPEGEQAKTSVLYIHGTATKSFPTRWASNCSSFGGRKRFIAIGAACTLTTLRRRAAVRAAIRDFIEGSKEA